MIVGVPVSTVIAKTAGTSLTLPAASVAYAVTLCNEPADKSIYKVKLPLLFAVTVPNEVVPLHHSTEAFASAVPEMVKPLVSLVRLSLLLLPLSSSLAKSKLIGAVGLQVSMVTVAVDAVETLPAISTA